MHFIPAPPLPVPGRPVQLFAHPARSGALTLTSSHILEWSGDHWALLAGPALSPGEEFLNLATDGEGGVWVRSTAALWHCPQGGVWHRVRADMRGGFSFSSRLERDAQGWIWFDDADGLWRMNGTRREKYGNPGEDAKGGMVDREGGIWIRSDHGVNRTLGRSRWVGYDTRDGLATNLVWQPIRDRQGRLWAATDKGLCAATATGFRTILPGRILSVALAPDGHVWATGSPGGVVFEVDPRSMTWKTFTVDVLPRGRITSGLAVDARGCPWVADRYGGLARGTRSGSGWTWSQVTNEGLVPRVILGVLALPEGGVIVLHDGTASLVRDGLWTGILDLLPELPGAVALGPGGKLAFAYRNRPVITLHELRGGQVVHTGTVSVQGESRTMLSVFSVAMDSAGRVWIGSNIGLGVVSGPQAASVQMMGMEDRLVSPECNEWSILAEPGRVWLGTTTGLASFSSDLPATPPALKRPLLLWAKAGPTILDPDGDPPELPRKYNELELRFMVPTYQAPGRIHYEAMLEGVDPGWVKLEEAHLRYAGLRAGRHVLHLRGVLPEIIDGPELALRFTVIPAWWETPWAQTLGLLAVGGGVWLLFWLRNITLKARNRQLQEEVARQTRALQEASRAKSAFLANMSHELRTPLNAILLYSELLKEEANERGLASTREDASRISQAGSSLLNLIDDILDISKIEAGHMQMEIREIEVAPFLESIDSALRPVVERNGNLFHVEGASAPRLLSSDPTRLQQILGNLLGNAAKFTEKGEVTLRSFSEPDWAVFEVEDTGIGMTSEEQRKVFSEFVQADSGTTRKYGGTGLGLTLVQRLTGMLGGEVSMESQPGVGTRVTVRLPLRRP